MTLAHDLLGCAGRAGRFSNGCCCGHVGNLHRTATDQCAATSAGTELREGHPDRHIFLSLFPLQVRQGRPVAPPAKSKWPKLRERVHCVNRVCLSVIGKRSPESTKIGVTVPNQYVNGYNLVPLVNSELNSTPVLFGVGGHQIVALRPLVQLRFTPLRLAAASALVSALAAGYRRGAFPSFARSG